MIFTSPSPYNILATRARQLLDGLEADIQAGRIATQVELLAGLTVAVGQFRDLLSGPAMRIRPMRRDDLLLREDVTLPLADAAGDVGLAFGHVEQIRDLTLGLFNLCQAERAGLAEQLAEATALVDDYRLWVSDSDPSFMWLGDSFNDKSRVDAASTAFVEVHGGTVTLQPVSSTDLAAFVVAATLDRKVSAGGLPGNNLEIQAPGQEAFTGSFPEPEPVRFADLLPPSDRLAAVWDGRPDTWFEWERVAIDPTQPTMGAGQALIYDPAGKTPYQTKKKTILGIFHSSKKGGLQIPTLPNWNCFRRWPGDAAIDSGESHKGFPLAYFQDSDRITLRLGIDITLDQPRRISWLTLTPLIRGSAYPQVDQILVSADGTHWRALLDTPTILNPRINRGVDYSALGSSASNFEGVGVWAFPAQPIRSIKLVLSQSNSYACPLGLAHRFTLGGKHRKRQQGPVPVVGNPASVPGAPAEVDFARTETETQGAATTAYDIFAGTRQLIGIRDLGLEARQYAATSRLLSRPFTLDRPAKAAALLTSEKIPAEWPHRAPDGGPWIRYEVSADGESWAEIVPQAGGALENSVVAFAAPTTTLFFRATFTRPDDAPTQSPLLESYSLKLLPAG